MVSITTFHEDMVVGMLAEIVAVEYGVAPAKARQIRLAALLHDIGKQKLQHLVNKPGKLTDAEIDAMKAHTILGAEMLATFQGELGDMARAIALWHHEHWDGNGYFGKYLCELPYFIEIVAIADVFTALVYERQYKQSWPPEEAIAYIQSQEDVKFSPVLVGIFVPLVQNNSRIAAIFKGGERHTGRFGI